MTSYTIDCWHIKLYNSQNQYHTNDICWQYMTTVQQNPTIYSKEIEISSFFLNIHKSFVGIAI